MTVLDGAPELDARAPADPGAAAVMERLKARFDPPGVLGAIPIAGAR